MKYLKKYIPRYIKVIIKKYLFLKNNSTIRISHGCEIDLSVSTGKYCSFGPNTLISMSTIGNYTYFAGDAQVSNASIGSFCSIGPGFRTGLGKHPTNIISTSPIFYSTKGQLPVKWAAENFYNENDPVKIHDNVWIGANVIVLDGITIGEGAICAAGTVVSKDVPPYSIVGGVPAKVIKYRFEDEIINQLLQMNIFSKDEAWLKENMVGLVGAVELLNKHKI